MTDNITRMWPREVRDPQASPPEPTVLEAARAFLDRIDGHTGKLTSAFHGEIDVLRAAVRREEGR